MPRARLILFSLATLAPAAHAQPYTIEAYTIDGGGGVSSGSPFTLSGTIGQPDAGPILTAGSFELQGGFWASATAGPCNASDFSPPYGTLDFSDVIAFLTDFGAEQPPADLSPPFGTYDFSDVLAFLTAFGAGCP
jgi:hypothetical protein